MSLHNTVLSYGPVARALHWTTAALILILLPLGFIAESASHAVNAPGAAPSPEDLDRVVWLFSLHKTLGVLTLGTAVLRILWALMRKRPAPLHPERRLETFAAEAIHFALYGALIAVPLSGWVHHAATSGFAPIWGIGQTLPFVPQSATVARAASMLHELSVWLLIGTLALHVAGALKHALIDRDATLARMTRGAVPRNLSATPHRAAPATALAALVLWALIPTLAAFDGAFALQTKAPALQQAQSEWQVTQGTLAIAITQMGKRVEGRFSDWTADIRFDPDAPADQKGEVTVTISIPSLELGSVADQAMGPDYFDAQTFATARFSGPIRETEQGYVADGTLSIKDRAIPLSLPFSLKLEGDTATASGMAQTDRRDFAIGSGVTEPGTLGFGVEIGFDLTAIRP